MEAADYCTGFMPNLQSLRNSLNIFLVKPKPGQSLRKQFPKPIEQVILSPSRILFMSTTELIGHVAEPCECHLGPEVHDLPVDVVDVGLD